MGSNISSTVESFDPHSYTSGRWLDHDELQRNSRFIQFDFAELCKTAIKLYPEAKKVIKCVKKEGGFNRVFLLTLDSGHHLAAKLPTQIAGPPRLTTNSEVATMEYLRLKTSLPIPKILTWSDDASNPVGSEYIIQEHVAGVQLHETWPSMSTHQHMLCTKAISLQIIKEMAALNFLAYGSLYFSDSTIHLPNKIILDDKRFCIGPTCSPVFWNCSPGESELYGKASLDCGPWENLSSYSHGLISTAYSRIPQKDKVKNEPLPHHGSIEDHIELIKASQRLLECLTQDPRVQKAASPTLLHADLHKRNIYVSPDDPTVITGIIDWQSTSVEPAFSYANEIPDFASLPDPIQLNEMSEPTASAEQKKRLEDLKICHQTYDVITKGLVPKLKPAKSLDSTLYRPFLYCHTSWRDSSTALRQELMELSAQWSELGMGGSCPYSPNNQEIAEHARHYEDFETVQRLRMWLKESLNTDSDGWVPTEVWDAAKDAHTAAYNEWMETAREGAAKGDGLTVEKADRLWPFDHRD